MTPASRRSLALPAAPPGGRASVGLLALLVVLTGVGLGIAGRVGAAPPVRHTVADLASPSQRQVVCPPATSAATSYAGLLPGAEGTVTADGQPLTVPPAGVASAPATGRTPLVLEASGKATHGLFATRALTHGGAAACSAPRASWWFTGAGASPAHFSQLHLVNPRPGPAIVDVDVYGPDGPVKAAGLRGVTVTSGSTRTLDLADVSPAGGNLVVHVEASRGLVVADLVDRVRDVLDPKAVPVAEWISSTRAPSRHLVVSGIPRPGGTGASVTDLSTLMPSATGSDVTSASPGGPPTGSPSGTPSGSRTTSPSAGGPATGRPSGTPTGSGSTRPPGLRPGSDGPTLVIANPGNRETVATIQLSGRRGTFTPKSLVPQTIAPQSTVSVSLTGIVGNATTSILVSGDHQLLAGYLVPGKSDLVHAVSAVPWIGPAAAAIPARSGATLVLTARDRAESLTVTQYSASGRLLDRRQVELEESTTITRRLAGRTAAVVVTSADGGAVGSVLVERGGETSTLPLTPVLAALRVPAVRPAG